MQRTAAIALAVALLALCAENAFARGGFRGGGFRFAGGYRSLSGIRFTRSARGSFFHWGSSSRRGAAGSFGRARIPRNTAEAIGGSRASMASARSLYANAERQGTLFTTREEAASAFRARYAGSYTSRFAALPASRPAYIPETTSVAGKTVNVRYSPQRGGYGYVDPTLGRWVFFNALANAAVMNSLLASHYYWWGAPPAYYAAGGGGFFGWGVGLFFAFMAFSALLRFIAQSRRRGW